MNTQTASFPDPDQTKLQPVRETPCQNILKAPPCGEKPATEPAADFVYRQVGYSQNVVQPPE